MIKYECGVDGCTWRREGKYADIIGLVRMSEEFDEHERTDHPEGAFYYITARETVNKRGSKG